MMLVGLISTKEEAKEIDYIMRLRCVGNRIRKISKDARYKKSHMVKK